MLDFADDDVIVSALVGVCGAFDGEVRRFSAARSENDLIRRLGVDQRGDLRARARERVARAEAELMQRRWTAASLAEKRPHRLEDLRQNRRGRLMIKKNAAHERSDIGSNV